MTYCTFGTPLAGECFRPSGSARPYARSSIALRRPCQRPLPGSLPVESYASIIAHILELDGFPAGDTPLPAGGDPLNGMAIQ